MKFTYRWGQRPLDGYTIKRGLGQGGFGEVYFALSDGGKEVALKLIRGHTDVELRGIGNCLNLKHPNLVHLYDLKTDPQGDRWLVMEFIQGEPLASILRRLPRGLPEAQARDWFLQAARAVDFLHDHAVVHRDVKPANLFIENGIVKLGDYGLSKSVSATQHSQSSNVGTIHYMAPEVASGAYSKQVDIYACGVMFYEMLTGELPFKGDSWAEIAIKHQTDLPDMSGVPSAYVPILEKALNKKADRRYAGMSEMVRAIEAIGVSKTAAEPRPRLEASPDRVRAIKVEPAPAPPGTTPAKVDADPIGELSSTLFWTPLATVPAAAIWAAFTGEVNWNELGTLYLIMVMVSWAILIPTKLFEGQSTSRPRRASLFALGAMIGLIAYGLSGWNYPQLLLGEESAPTPGMTTYWGGFLQAQQGTLQVLTNFVLFFALALGIPRWWLAAERRRPERFTFYPLLAAGACGLVLSMFWQMRAPYNDSSAPGHFVLALAGAAAVVQLVSSWSPPPRVSSRNRRRHWHTDTQR